MASTDDLDEEEDKRRADIDQIDMMKSYLAFVWRSVKKHRKLSILAFVGAVTLCLSAYALWPRSYRCESTIVFYPGGALSATEENNPFRSASEVVRRRESLLEAIKATDLVRRYPLERAPLLQVKDKLWAFLGRQMSERDIEAALVWSLESAISVDTSETTLTIGVNWGNAEMAARLVSALQKILLNARHVAEISTIQEKMAILEGHSREVRKEIDAIAQELNDARKEQLEGLEAAAKPSPAAPVAAAPPLAPRPVRSAPRPAASSALSPEEIAQKNEALAQLKEDLEVKKRAFAELKNQRSQALITAQSQLSELLTKYTRVHPEVVRAERTIASLSERSPQMVALDSEIKTLEAKIKQSGVTPASTGRATGGGRAAQATPAALAAQEALPADILRLLEPAAQTDTAVNVQLEGAVGKYATLREGIRNARVDLDTAQAAFAHRYKIVQPPEPPLRPSKPQPGKVLGIGFLAALLLALVLPIAAELRAGTIVERWQIYQMQLPVLAELPMPRGPGE